MATAVIETVEARCARYVEENHFVGTEVDRFRHIRLRVGPVDAIRMPRPLGELVRAELGERELVTPIFESHAPRYLTFITRPALPDKPLPLPVVSALFKALATPTSQGSLLTLPGPDGERHRWLDEPVGDQRPDFEVVLEIVLGAVRARSTAVRP